ncbi:MAG: hypothetical protein ACKVKX_10235 [Pseudomonadales bacterium]
MALSHVMNIISNAGAVSAGTGSGGGGGGGGNLDSQTVTVGQSSSPTGGSGAPTGTTVRRGFLISGSSVGSISDGTSNLYSGASILEIKYQWDTTYPLSMLSLTIQGLGRANSGWTTLTIGTTSYQRSSASYVSGAQSNGGNSGWFWYPSSYDYNGTEDPFGNTGGTTTCVFT